MESKFGLMSIHHNDCQYILPGSKQNDRCSECSTLRKTLTTQAHRFSKSNSEAITSSHINYRYKILLILFVFNICILCLNRYQSLSSVVSRLGSVQKECHTAKVRLNQLKDKISTTSETTGIILDEEAHEVIKVRKHLQIHSIIISYYLQTIASEEFKFLDDQPKDSFKNIFWQQQLEAARKKDARAMRWHPLMIRWCLYIRHR